MMPSRIILRLAFAFVVAAVSPFAAGQPGAPVEIDRIAAVVNSEAITEHELQQQTLLVQRQLREQNIEVPPPDVLERQVLERMIVDRAQMQLARDSGLRVVDVQL